jgi:hypothetical protein
VEPAGEKVVDAQDVAQVEEALGRKREGREGSERFFEGGGEGA